MGNRPIFDVDGWSWLYFSTFIIFSAFIVANIFFGELVTNAQKLAQTADEDETGASNDMTHERLEQMNMQLQTLQAQNEILQKQLNQVTVLLQQETRG